MGFIKSLKPKAKPQPQPLVDEAKQNEKKWGKSLMAAGWTALPSIILEKQHALGIDAVDLCIVMQIAKHWWKANELPFPSKASLAAAAGVDERTVQRHIAAMERAGLMQRIYRQREDGGHKSNEYKFDGLIAAATKFADEKLQAREAQKSEDRARKARKKPHLKPVPASDDE